MSTLLKELDPPPSPAYWQEELHIEELEEMVMVQVGIIELLTVLALGVMIFGVAVN